MCTVCHVTRKVNLARPPVIRYHRVAHLSSFLAITRQLSLHRKLESKLFPLLGRRSSFPLQVGETPIQLLLERPPETKVSIWRF